MEKLKGVFSAIVTPMNADESVNVQALKPLIDMNLERGAAGFYVCGSTGESYMLSLDERKRLLEGVVEANAGRGRVMANIGTFCLRQSLDLAKHATSLGVSAISSVAPFYFPFTKDELVNYYFALAEESGMPTLVYNVPALAGVEFTTEDLFRLLEHPGIAGIKQTSMNLFQTELLARHFPEKSIINGHDEIFLSALSVGVTSCIGSTVSFMPEMYVEIFKRYNAHEYAAAQRLQGRVNEIVAVLCKIGVFKGCKAALQDMGIDCGSCRKPFAPLSDDERKLLKETIQRYRKVVV